MDPTEIRGKCPQFRILVIGRANAGKTTLLKSVCMSKEDPEIFDPTGNKIKLSVVQGTAERGEHNVENQLVFKSNHGFVFHDSRGFEAGSEKETEEVKAFIERRANTHNISEQLHAIWYCIPTDNARPILKADEDFFNTAIRGDVPLIVIFTKFDSVMTRAFQQLRDSGTPIRRAHAQKIKIAETMLDENFLRPLQSTTFPPKVHLHVTNMHEPGHDCADLIETTANSITDDALKMLFVSVQQNNINLCTEHAVQWVLKKGHLDLSQIVKGTVPGYPHTWHRYALPLFLPRRPPRPPSPDRRYELLPPPSPQRGYEVPLDEINRLLMQHAPQMASTAAVNAANTIVAAADICIITEQSFFIAQQEQQQFQPSFLLALQGYLRTTAQSSLEEAVMRVYSTYASKSERAQTNAIKTTAQGIAQIIKEHRLGHWPAKQK